MCDFHKNDNDNKNKNKKGDEDMAKVIKRVETNKTEMRSINEILNKGIKRYDKALKKLSKN